MTKKDSNNISPSSPDLNIPKPEINNPPKVIKEKVIVKVPEVNPQPEPIPEPPKPSEIKPKREYKKDPEKIYGRPKKDEEIKHTNLNSKYPASQKKLEKIEKPKMPNMFWVGVGLGAIAGGIGLVLLIRKIKEHMQSEKEVDALKYIYEELEKQSPEQLNDKFLSE